MLLRRICLLEIVTCFGVRRYPLGSAVLLRCAAQGCTRCSDFVSNYLSCTLFLLLVVCFVLVLLLGRQPWFFLPLALSFSLILNFDFADTTPTASTAFHCFALFLFGAMTLCLKA